MKLNKQLSESILSNIDGDKRFFCVDGQVLHNMEELQKALKLMDENSFIYHANDERNDFAAWINDVLGDVRFAEKFSQIRNQKEAAKKVRARITYIKKYC